MAQQNDTGFKSYIAATDLLAYRAVELAATANQVQYPSAVSDRLVGITQAPANSGEPVTVKLLNAPGTYRITVGAACSAGSALYMLATAGKFSTADPGSAVLWMVAEEAGAGDLSEVEARLMKVG